MAVAIVQARMGSSRLSGKVMCEILGKPMLWHIIDRLKRSKMIEKIVIATTNEQTDKPILELAQELGVDSFAGNEDDVLDRYYQAAKQYAAKTIVRITGDCPLIDPRVIERVIQRYSKGDCDYAANTLKRRTYPDGLDVEVFSYAALEKAWKEARWASERDHVAPYIWKNPDKFRLTNVENEVNLSHLRWCVDEARDLQFVREVYAKLHKEGEIFHMEDILVLLEKHPQLMKINQGITTNQGYAKSLEEDRIVRWTEATSMSNKGQSLYRKAKLRIPGGTQLFSKRPELFLPEQWPSYYSKAEGAEVWDLDDSKYVDMSYMGLGACILGYADPEVDNAVKAAIASGSMCTLNCPEEVELADLLCELHPWAEMVRYARTGGEAMAIAVRIARAKTKKDKIAFCGYHGWHDWYLAANLGEEDVLDGHLLPGLEPAGVPRSLRDTAFAFHYNEIEELRAIVSQHRDEIGTIVMEPVRNHKPEPGFLEEAREIATSIKAVLIFDEVSSGWRLTTGGAHLLYEVTPDIAVFAKAMSNGYPMAAIIGIGDVMRAAQDSFISSTCWTERIGPAAALATIHKHQRCNVSEHLIEIGERVQFGWKSAADQHGVKISVSGIPPLGHFSFEYESGQAIRTLFTQEMLQKGFLATNGFFASYAHQDHHVENYLKAVDETFALAAKAIERNEVEKLLKGPVAHSGFHRLT